MKQEDFCKRLNYNSSKNVSTHEQLYKNNQKDDIQFLRKLLVLNKQEEKLINKRLAKLMTEDVFSLSPSQGEKNNYLGKSTMSLGTHLNSTGSSYNCGMYKRKSVMENMPSQSLLSKDNNTFSCSQYKLKGKRIWADRLNEEEEEEEFFDCEKTIEKMDESVVGRISKNTISKTSVKHQSGLKTSTLPSINLTRKTKSTTWNENKNGEDESERMKKSMLSVSENRPRGEVKSSKMGSDQSQGDGAQNDKVRCNRVLIKEYSEMKKKKLLKVWNFCDIPKTKSKNTIPSNSIKTVAGSCYNIRT